MHLDKKREMHIKRTMTSGVDYTFHFMKHMFKRSNCGVSHRESFKQTQDADEKLGPDDQPLN